MSPRAGVWVTLFYDRQSDFDKYFITDIYCNLYWKEQHLLFSMHGINKGNTYCVFTVGFGVWCAPGFSCYEYKTISSWKFKTVAVKRNNVILQSGEICFSLYFAEQIVQHEYRTILCLRTGISYTFVLWSMFRHNRHQILRNHNSFFYDLFCYFFKPL
jgi:hypothetical protein